MRKTVAAFAIFAGASAARPASAEGEALPLSLTWEAPRGCADDAFVARRVGQILHGMRSTTSVVARGKVARLADGRFELTLTLHTDDIDDTKTIAATSCAALAEAAAVVLALAIAPTGEMPSEATEPPPASPNIEPPAPHEGPKSGAEPKAPPPAEVAPETGPRVAVGIGASIASGMLPELSGGAIISGALRLDRFRVGVLGTFSLRQNPIFDEPAGASFDMIEAGAFTGYLVPIGRFAIGPCLNVEMTHVRVRGFGIRQPRTSTTISPTVVLGARAEAELSRWLALFARADIVVPLDPPTFTLVTSATSVHLHEPALLGPRLSLGAEIVFP